MMTKKEREEFETYKRVSEKWFALEDALSNIEDLKKECFSKSKDMDFVWTQRITNELMRFYEVVHKNSTITTNKLCNIILAYESSKFTKESVK